MYESGPDVAELAKLGLTLDDVEKPEVEVWEENWQVFLLMRSMQTQWRVGAGGPTGLDYNVLPFMLKTAKIPKGEWPEVLENLKVMELEALRVMNQDKGKV